MEPWLLPAAELRSQRIFRVRLASPDGKGSFRLLLRLDSEQRYRIDATHPLLFNRRLWSLDVHGDEALMVDYLQKLHCRYEGEAEIAAVPLGPFPFDSLPKLLLGYLPASPLGAVSTTAADRLDYRDPRGRRWSAWLQNRVVGRWILWQDQSERAIWGIEDDRAQLEAPAEGLSLRWRETRREPLSGDVRSLEPPAGTSAGSCDLGWIRGVEDTEGLPLED